LSQRGIHEEALATFRAIPATEVVDPAALLFHRSVSEHALLLKDDAGRTIERLLEVAGTPERYQTVGLLMLLDMQTWKDKDLAAVARKMGNIGRRLDLARGGPVTQKLQREVIFRLDELIKQLETPPPPGPPGDGPPKDGDGPPKGGKNPTRPLDQSQIVPDGPNTGNVDKIKLLMGRWNGLPPRERAEALQELTRGMPPRYREAVETYFRKLLDR
jgi:hypothetical protein